MTTEAVAVTVGEIVPAARMRPTHVGATALAPVAPSETLVDRVKTELNNPSALDTLPSQTDDFPFEDTAQDTLDKPGAEEDAGGMLPETQTEPAPGDAAWESWKLITEAQKGNGDAQARIYEEYCDLVFKYIRFRTGNEQLAEDLTADTFYRALKKLPDLTWQGKDIGAWLTTIARNLVIDHFKSSRVKLETPTGDILDADTTATGPEGNPEEATLAKITREDLRAAVEKLKPQQRQCIEFRFLLDFSVDETAAKMGLTEGAVKALQHRAVRALGRMLAGTGISPSFS